jgi:hypothetical protein
METAIDASHTVTPTTAKKTRMRCGDGVKVKARRSAKPSRTFHQSLRRALIRIDISHAYFKAIRLFLLFKDVGDDARHKGVGDKQPADAKQHDA